MFLIKPIEPFFVQAILELSDTQTLESRQLLSRAVAALDNGLLMNIATSGPMSKALLDTIFTADGDIYSTAREKAMNSLMVISQCTRFSLEVLTQFCLAQCDRPELSFCGAAHRPYLLQ